jgi:hypothetical protein
MEMVAKYGFCVLLRFFWFNAEKAIEPLPTNKCNAKESKMSVAAENDMF